MSSLAEIIPWLPSYMKDLDSEKFGSGWVVCWSWCLLACANCMHPSQLHVQWHCLSALELALVGVLKMGNWQVLANQVSTPSLLNRYSTPHSSGCHRDQVQPLGGLHIKTMKCQALFWSYKVPLEIVFSSGAPRLLWVSDRGLCFGERDWTLEAEAGDGGFPATRSESGTESIFRDTFLPL